MSVRLSTGLAARLLGTHVGGRPEHRRLRACRRRSSSATASDPVARVASRYLREPKVEHLDNAVWRDLDVGGLQISVDDPFLMRGLEGIGDLSRNRQCFGQGNGAARDAIGETSSPSTSSITSAGRPSSLFEAINGADVGMIERREHASFALEAREPVGVGGERVRQEP